MPLMEFAEFDRRPILVAIAGPNGAGKTTFFHAHLASAGLRFVNADVLVAELAVELYHVACLSRCLEKGFGRTRGEFRPLRRYSPIQVGDIGTFLTEAASGAATSSCSVTLASPASTVSRSAAWRCAFRREATTSPTTSSGQGFLDRSSISRPLSRNYSHVLIYDNSEFNVRAYRQVAVFDHGQLRRLQEPVLEWLRPMLP